MIAPGAHDSKTHLQRTCNVERTVNTKDRARQGEGSSIGIGLLGLTQTLLMWRKRQRDGRKRS